MGWDLLFFLVLSVQRIRGTFTEKGIRKSEKKQVTSRKRWNLKHDVPYFNLQLIWLIKLICTEIRHHEMYQHKPKMKAENNFK